MIHRTQAIFNECLRIIRNSARSLRRSFNIYSWSQTLHPIVNFIHEVQFDGLFFFSVALFLHSHHICLHHASYVFAILVGNKYFVFAFGLNYLPGLGFSWSFFSLARVFFSSHFVDVFGCLFDRCDKRRMETLRTTPQMRTAILHAITIIPEYWYVLKLKLYDNKMNYRRMYT